MSEQISIEGLNKADVLAALYNEAKTQGYGVMEYTPEPMSTEEAQQIIEERQATWHPSQDMYFDYLKGRVMKVDLSGDTLRTVLYDRDNGEGKAAQIIEDLKSKSAIAA